MFRINVEALLVRGGREAMAAAAAAARKWRARQLWRRAVFVQWQVSRRRSGVIKYQVLRGSSSCR